jgi:phage recombination protein Bet
MSTELVLQGAERNNRIAFTQDQKNIIRQICCPGATDSELAFFIEMSQEKGLSPFSREVYAYIDSPKDPTYRKLITIVGIDGLTKIAQRSGEFQGFTPTQYFVEVSGSGQWSDVFIPKYHTLLAIRKGIRRVGYLEPSILSIPLAAYQRTTGRWPVDPAGMLEKCIKAKLIREVFPDEASGLSISEEIMGELRTGNPNVQYNTALPKLSHRIPAAQSRGVLDTLFEEFKVKREEMKPAQIEKYMAIFTEAYQKFSASWSQDDGKFMTADEMGVTFEEVPTNQEEQTA